jgi:hypothetical protein
MRLERGLKGRDEALKLVQGQAGEIQELCRAGLQVSEPDGRVPLACGLFHSMQFG